MKTEHPFGIQNVGHSKWQTCNQCGKAMEPQSLKQIVFDFCSKCFNNINPPENFKIIEKKNHINESKNDVINKQDEELNDLEEIEKKQRKRQHSELILSSK